MSDYGYPEDPLWKEALQKLSEIRERGVYDSQDVEFIREGLKSLDDRIRGGAALTAEGCLFEPYIIDLLLQLVEEDANDAVRKAAVQSLYGLIYEGVMQNLETESGSDTHIDEAEDWTEIQEETLREEYQRVKHVLLQILADTQAPTGVREAALGSLSPLGFLPEIKEFIREFLESGRKSSQAVALHAMGKFPHLWEEEIARFIEPDADKTLLLEAISAAYSSQSARLAARIEAVLRHPDPDVLVYALMSLANINRTENLGAILQKFSLHSHPRVQEAAKDAIELFSRRNMGDYLERELGYED